MIAMILDDYYDYDFTYSDNRNVIILIKQACIPLDMHKSCLLTFSYKYQLLKLSINNACNALGAYKNIRIACKGTLRGQASVGRVP